MSYDDVKLWCNNNLSKSIDGKQSGTTEEVFLEMSPTVQDQQMPNSDGIIIPIRTQQEQSKNQQHSKEKINKNDDIVFLNKNDVTKVNCENEPKRVGENDLFSTCKCDNGDDDVDVVEDLTRRNDCGAGPVKTL